MARYDRPYGIRSHKHDAICEICLTLLRDGPSKLTGYPSNAVIKARDVGLIHRAQGLYHLNLDMWKQCSYVVTDDLYEKLADNNYQRSLRGLPPITEKQYAARARRDSNSRRKRQESRKPITLDGDIALRDVLLPQEDK